MGIFMGMGLDSLKEQLVNVIAQRDQYSSAFQQAVGAINLLQEQIKCLMIEEGIAKKKLEDEAPNTTMDTVNLPETNQGDANGIEEG